MSKHSENQHIYDDIIKLPHHVSSSRPHMPISDRAAQFSPFAALTGYETAIRETARLTDQKIEVDENSKAVLNEKIWKVAERINEHPSISITYFLPDEKKDGGTYVTVTDRIKKIDEYKRQFLLSDGTRIPMDDVIDLEGEVFNLSEYSP